MGKISEKEFARLCAGVRADREAICRHNPLGTPEETLLWMLAGCLISYLSLSEAETPCFTGAPDAETYKNAICFVLENKKSEKFEIEKYLSRFADN